MDTKEKLKDFVKKSQESDIEAANTILKQVIDQKMDERYSEARKKVEES